MTVQRQRARRYCRGFTLLELIVVVSILGMITSLATEYYVLSGNRERYEITAQRIQQVRTAIIGDSHRTLNGAAMLSGFVVDVGRLPTSLRALLEPAYCENAAADSHAIYLTEQSCHAAAGVWQDQRDEGWQGPYLQATGYEVVIDSGDGQSREVPVFRDGWGTSVGVHRQDFENSGWRFERLRRDDQGSSRRSDDRWLPDAYGNNLLLQSYGLDGLAGTLSSPDSDVYAYEQDYPAFDMQYAMPLITEAAFSGGAVAVTVQNQLADTVALCLSWSGQDAGHVQLTGDYALAAGSSITFPEDLAPQAPVQGVIKLAAVLDVDNDCATDDGAAYPGEVVFSPASTVAVHPAVAAAVVRVQVIKAPLPRTVLSVQR